MGQAYGPSEKLLLFLLTQPVSITLSILEAVVCGVRQCWRCAQLTETCLAYVSAWVQSPTLKKRSHECVGQKIPPLNSYLCFVDYWYLLIRYISL